MSYTISLGKVQSGQFVINLDSPCPLGIPPFVTIGIGDRKKRYSDWLEGSIDNDGNNKDKSQRLNFLAFIHKVGIEQGYVNLESKHSLKSIQTECVKDFLIKHREFLDNILPYLFSDVVRVTELKQNTLPLKD